jgi:hypothetical protein
MKDPKAELADFHQTVLMDAMIQVTGVDHLAAVDLDGGRSYVRARAKCHGCACKSECREWLAAHSQAEPQPFAPMLRSFGR